MPGMDMFMRSRWMGGFVQYADPIPPGPHVYGPPPYGVWPTSIRRPVQAHGAPIAPSDILKAQAEDRAREDDREKALFIEKKKKIGQQIAPTTAPTTPSAGKDIAAALLPKPADRTMVIGGIAIAILGLGTRIFAQEKTATQTLASAAAIVGGAGLVYKGLQG